MELQHAKATRVGKEMPTLEVSAEMFEYLSNGVATDGRHMVYSDVHLIVPEHKKVVEQVMSFTEEDALNGRTVGLI